jgi:hypothetical protein
MLRVVRSPGSGCGVTGCGVSERAPEALARPALGPRRWSNQRDQQLVVSGITLHHIHYPPISNSPSHSSPQLSIAVI